MEPNASIGKFQSPGCQMSDHIPNPNGALTALPRPFISTTGFKMEVGDEGRDRHQEIEFSFHGRRRLSYFSAMKTLSARSAAKRARAGGAREASGAAERRMEIPRVSSLSSYSAASARRSTVRR